MYALQMVAFGDPTEVVKLVEMPNPPALGDDEVLVAIEYAPINASVLLMIRGLYGVRPSLPADVGNEGVGRVLALGKAVMHLTVNDRVVIPPTHYSWRERVTLPANDLFALPADADPQQLSMLYINPPTAALLLSERVQLSPGDWVIQNAGNSGVGRWVIAAARERDLKTVSLVRRPDVVKELSAAGADVVLVDGVDGVDGEGVAERVAEATGHAQIKLALDGVAGNAMPSLTGSLSPGGTLVVYAFMSEQPGLANPRDIIFRGVTIRGFWLESPEMRNSPKLVEAIKAGARLVAEGKVRVPIAAVYPLTAPKEALAHALKGGKVLFQCS
jgi:NADPH:quinone reductase-like Zn-dependent oxidoreductase